MDTSFYIPENVSKEKLREIEEELTVLASYDPDFILMQKMDQENWDILEDLLLKRRWILNQLFEFTPENIERIRRVDDCLRNLTLKLYERVKAMDAKSKLILDDPEFDDSYDVEGTIKFSWYDSDSVMKLNDDEYYGSNFSFMISLIDNFNSTGDDWTRNIFYIHSSYINIDEDWANWSDSPLTHPDLKVCYASQYICCLQNYSIPDFIRLNGFWTEVKFIEHNIRCAEGKRWNEK